MPTQKAAEKFEISWSNASAKKPVLSSKNAPTRKNRQAMVAKNRSNSITSIKTGLQQKFKKMALKKSKVNENTDLLRKQLCTDQEIKENNRQQKNWQWKISMNQRRKRFLANRLSMQKMQQKRPVSSKSSTE